MRSPSRFAPAAAVLWLAIAAMRAAGAPPDPVEPTALDDAQKQRDAARAPLAAAMVDAYPNWNGIFTSLVASWSPDGKRILFGSLRDGMPQIYLGDPARPGAAPKAITAGPERALWASFTRNGKGILFTRDTRGDEVHHVWRTGPEGGEAKDLTPEPGLRCDEPELPPKRPDTMIYSASRVTSPESMVFVRRLDGSAPRLVYTNPRPGGVVGTNADGSRVLFVDWRSASDIVLLDVDAVGGRARRLYPPEARTAGVFGAAYSADGRLVYATTDEGSESSVLLALDAVTGKEVARYANASPPGALLEARVAPDGRRIALGVDAGNHGEVRILDARRLTVQRSVKLPLGLVKLGAFRPDGKAFSVLVSSPDRPPDVYAVDAASGAVRGLRADARPGIEALAAIETSIEEVKAFDDLVIPVNLYLPKARGGRRLPTIALFHGGPAASSAVRWNPFARFFLSLGYAVVEPNVRGSTGFGRAYEKADDREKRADWLRDLESVNAWARAQPWCDSERVVVMGGSYGGYTTLMALTRQPGLWRAGVDLFGVADLKAFLRTTDAAIRSIFVEEFGDLDADSGLLEAFSPLRDVDRIVAPLFVYAGQNDPRVPRSESDAIVRALRARGIPVEYMVASNEGHTVDRRETKVEVLARMARFLEDAMKGPPAGAR